MQSLSGVDEHKVKVVILNTSVHNLNMSHIEQDIGDYDSFNQFHKCVRLNGRMNGKN